MKHALLLPCALACSSAALAESGDVLWQQEVDGYVSAISTAEGRVLVAGQASTRNKDFLVAAYDAMTGGVLWQDLVDKGGFPNELLAITQTRGLVFVVGSAEYDFADDSSAFLVRAYDSSGEFIWESEINDGRLNVATSVVADQERVYAGGLRRNDASELDFVLRAYHALTGNLLWQKNLGRAPMSIRSRRSPVPSTPLPLCIVGNTLIIGGTTAGADDLDLLVQGYDARTGSLVWQDQYQRSGSTDRASMVTAAGNRAFAIGTGSSIGGNVILISAVRASDGHSLWKNQYETSDGSVGAVSTATLGDAVFVAGYLCKPSGLCELLVLAYDAESGALRWQDRYDAGFFTLPFGMAAESGRLFVVGGAQATPGAGGYFVRSYNARTGQLEWWDQSDELSSARSIASDGGKVFIGGFADLLEGSGTLLRAYRAK